MEKSNGLVCFFCLENFHNLFVNQWGISIDYLGSLLFKYKWTFRFHQQFSRRAISDCRWTRCRVWLNPKGHCL